MKDQPSTGSNTPTPNEDQTKTMMDTGAWFAPTHWSVVREANQETGKASEALDRVLRTYWPPVYAFIRRRGFGRADAQDLTQGFFAHLLDGDRLAKAAPQRGRFRNFLLACVTNYMRNEADKGKTLKRGGQFEIVPLEFETEEGRFIHEGREEVTPETEFERRWVAALLDQVAGQLREEYVHAGKTAIFDALEPFLTGQAETGSYAKIATQLKVTENAVTVALHRMRRRYGDLLRQTVALTVDDPSEVDAEIRELFAAWKQE